MKKTVCCLLIFSIILANISLFCSAEEEFLPVLANGNELFVSPLDGEIGNDGSIESPLPTLSDAIKKAEPGDTIYLREGLYDEKNYISKRGKNDAWFIIKAYNGEKVVFDNNFGKSDSCLVFNSSAGFWQIEGFEIKNYTGAGIWIKGGSSYRIIDMNIHDISQPEESLYGTEALLAAGSNILVRGCYFHDIGKDRLAAHDHCIYMMTAQNWLIEDNLLTTAPGGGIHQFAGYGGITASNITIRNNTFSENLNSIVLSSCSDFKITDNVFLNSKESDFFILNRVENCLIKNNVFYNAFDTDSTFKKGSYKVNTIRDNVVKSYFIFSDDPEGFEDNIFYENLIIYEHLPFRVKFSGELKNIQKPERLSSLDKKNTYEDNVFYNFPVFNLQKISDDFALATALILSINKK